MIGQDRSGSEGSQHTGGVIGGAKERCLPLQANWIGSRAVVTMAVQCGFMAKAVEIETALQREKWRK
jgi:hypothetical protein